MQKAPSQRHYGMDWLRIGAFALLIFYHVGFSFTPWGYQTPTRGVIWWAEIPLLSLSAWRLALLFAISGYASAALFVKQGSTGPFLSSRVKRLGIPLLFGLIVLVPPQPYMGLIHSGYRHDYGYFLLHDAFAFHRVGGEYLPTDMHLWFVIYLLAYTLVLCAMSLLPVKMLALAQRGAEKLLAGWGLLPVGIAVIFAIRLLPGDWTDSHHFWHDTTAHLHYGLMFLFGVLLRRSEPLRRAIAHQWKLAVAVGLVGFAGVAVDAWFYPGNIPTPQPLQVPVIFAKAVQSWGAIIGLFGIADRFWNYDGRWRTMLVEAVFPFYLIHQTVQVATSYWLRDKGLTALPEFLLMVGATIVGCWAFYLIGREITPLRPLIGLGPRRARPART